MKLELHTKQRQTRKAHQAAFHSRDIHRRLGVGANSSPSLAGLGYDSYALSLRGHGKSEGRENVRQFTLQDFAEDIGWALDEIGGPRS